MVLRTMSQRERLAFELEADEHAAARARHRIIEASASYVDGDGADTLGLLVSEVVTNAVLHGGSDDALEVLATLESDRIRVEVRDQGDGFVPRPRALEPDAVGGWGLYLVEQLASSWGVSYSGRTTVWFELPCTAAEAA